MIAAAALGLPVPAGQQRGLLPLPFHDILGLSLALVLWKSLQSQGCCGQRHGQGKVVAALH